MTNFPLTCGYHVPGGGTLADEVIRATPRAVLSSLTSHLREQIRWLALIIWLGYSRTILFWENSSLHFVVRSHNYNGRPAAPRNYQRVHLLESVQHVAQHALEVSREDGHGTRPPS